MTWYAVPLAVIAVCWLISLRRTPYAALWMVVSVVAGFVAAIEATAAGGAHTTLLARLAVDLAGSLPVAFFAFCTECTAAESPNGNIGKWRKRHPTTLARPTPDWTVYTVSQEDDAVKVNVGIECGEGDEKRFKRLGTAEPLEDMDAFMELKAQAQSAADTMNALKVGL